MTSNKRLVEDKSSTTTVEYALIVAGVVLALVAGVQLLGANLLAW